MVGGSSASGCARCLLLKLRGPLEPLFYLRTYPLLPVCVCVCRVTASTLMNDVSSRSHAIFTLTFTQVRGSAQPPVTNFCVLVLPLCCVTYLCVALRTPVLRYVPLYCVTYLCVALRTSVLRYVPLCCVTYLCVALRTSVLRYVPLCCVTYPCVALRTPVLRYVPLCCVTYLCVALHTSVLRYVPLC